MPLTQPDEDTNAQACLAADQTTNEKSLEIKVRARAIFDQKDVVVIRTTNLMVVLKDKKNVGASRNLLVRA